LLDRRPVWDVEGQAGEGAGGVLPQGADQPGGYRDVGDGLQTRSFTFIDDCVQGILRITKSDFKEVRVSGF